MAFSYFHVTFDWARVQVVYSKTIDHFGNLNTAFMDFIQSGVVNFYRLGNNKDIFQNLTYLFTLVKNRHYLLPFLDHLFS